MDRWLWEANEWGLFACLLAALLAAAEVGFLISRRVRAPGESAPNEVASVQGAVLGLLALLLGFTFSLAMTRFETRKELVRDEANAIGTFALRTQLLPDPQRTRVVDLLRGYVATRFDLQHEGFALARRNAIHRASAELQDRIWAQAVDAARAQPESETMGLLLSSLNEMIDMHGKQMAAMRNRVPSAIFLLLFCVAVAALGLTGYAAGPSHKQHLSLTVLVALLITLVVMLILDLHRPTRGYVTVELANLIDLRDSLR